MSWKKTLNRTLNRATLLLMYSYIPYKYLILSSLTASQVQRCSVWLWQYNQISYSLSMRMENARVHFSVNSCRNQNISFALLGEKWIIWCCLLYAKNITKLYLELLWKIWLRLITSSTKSLILYNVVYMPAKYHTVEYLKDCWPLVISHQ